MTEKKCDLLIVGSGPAGMTAAIYAARAGVNTKILENTGAGGQILLTGEIDNFPGYIKINGAELAMNMQAQTEVCGAETIYDETVKMTLHEAKKTVVCADTTITAKAVIIAAGASPRKIGVPGEDKFIGAGVHFCALCDGAFYKDKDIVLVGGGNSAAEEAIYMSSIAKSVTVINNLPEFTAFATLVEKIKKLSNVKTFHNTTVKQILGGAKLSGIKTNLGKTIKCDGVFITIGRKPNTEFLGGAVELSAGGYIVVNQKYATSIPGVFAAGDIIEKSVRQIVTACADGACAATYAVEYVRTKG
jgi:thioredoxin reductase (NADPH)